MPLGAGNEKAQLLSNKTHYSPTDPDARISIKPGKARKFNYHCSLSVDTDEGVISHMQADFADGRDSQNLPDITLKLQQRLASNELHLDELLADTAGAPLRLLQWWQLHSTGAVEHHGRSAVAAGYPSSAIKSLKSKAFPMILKKITLPARRVSVYPLRRLTGTPMEAG